jgi:hypothetical protein
VIVAKIMKMLRSLMVISPAQQQKRDKGEKVQLINIEEAE